MKKEMALKKGLAIAGFMGSGKTTLGQAFASQVQAPFFDLDQLIEHTSQMSIAQIFQQKGEAYFRTAELNSLLNLHDRKLKPYVLSLGGGTPFVKGVSGMLESYVVIWFRFSWEILSERLFNNTIDVSKKRPLLRNLSQVRDLYNTRQSMFKEKYGDWRHETLEQIKPESTHLISKPKTMWCIEHLFDSSRLYSKILYLWRFILKSHT